jgi:hypothetical protein
MVLHRVFHNLRRDCAPVLSSGNGACDKRMSYPTIYYRSSHEDVPIDSDRISAGANENAIVDQRMAMIKVTLSVISAMVITVAVTMPRSIVGVG